MNLQGKYVSWKEKHATADERWKDDPFYEESYTGTVIADNGDKVVVLVRKFGDVFTREAEKKNLSKIS